MRRNPNHKGHKEAMNLATRKDTMRVSDCKRCGHAIAWAKSQKSGKWYPCNVESKRSENGPSDALRAAPWSVHTAESCDRNIDYDAKVTATFEKPEPELLSVEDAEWILANSKSDIVIELAQKHLAAHAARNQEGEGA